VHIFFEFSEGSPWGHTRFAIRNSPLSSRPASSEVHPFNRPSTQRSNARGSNFPSYLSSIRRMYKSFVLHPFIERLRAHPGFSSADPELISEAEAHPAYCLASRACLQRYRDAMRRERTRSSGPLSGMCMAPALGSGSGAHCFAEAQCARCLCAG
jgi:hypothetical protein